MNLYISKFSNVNFENSKKLVDLIYGIDGINITSKIEESDVVLILPGNLDNYYDLFYAIKLHSHNSNKIILYNDDYFYSSMIRNLYKLYENKYTNMVPSDYMIIEYELEKIVKIIEEML